MPPTPEPSRRRSWSWELSRRFEDLWDLDHAAADGQLRCCGAPEPTLFPRRFAIWVLLHPRRARRLGAGLDDALARVTASAGLGAWR